MSNFSLLRSLEVLPQGSLILENLTVVDAVKAGAQQQKKHNSRKIIFKRSISNFTVTKEVEHNYTSCTRWNGSADGAIRR